MSRPTRLAKMIGKSVGPRLVALTMLSPGVEIGLPSNTSAEMPSTRCQGQHRGLLMAVNLPTQKEDR